MPAQRVIGGLAEASGSYSTAARDAFTPRKIRSAAEMMRIWRAAATLLGQHHACGSVLYTIKVVAFAGYAGKSHHVRTQRAASTSALPKARVALAARK